jgi:hypothetical protein
VLSNGANYNGYQTFGPGNNNDNPVPVPLPGLRPSSPAPPPSSDNNYRPNPNNNNIPNADIRHFRSPENYLTSGQRPPPAIQFTQINSNFKPRPPLTPNPAVSAYNLKQYLNQPPDPTNTKPQPQYISPLSTELQQQQQQQPIGTSNINFHQQNNVNSLPQNLHHDTQYLKSIFPVQDLGPTSFTNFHHISDIFPNPSIPLTSLSPINQKVVHGQTHAATSDLSKSGNNYHDQISPEKDSYSYPVFESPNIALPAVQFVPSSTENPTSLQQQQSSLHKYVTTIRTLPAGHNSFGFPHDALSSAEVHKHEQRETNQHLVPPPLPPQQTEGPLYNQNPQQIQQIWQKLLREQQLKEGWSPVPQATRSLPPAYNKHSKDSFSGISQSSDFENQGSAQLELQTEGPFRPNTSPYGDSGGFVGVAYKDNIREASHSYTILPSTDDLSFKDQLGSNDHVRPQAAPPTSQRERQKNNLPNKNITEKPQRNIRRPLNRTTVSHRPTTSRHHLATESDRSQKRGVQTSDAAHDSDSDRTSVPYSKYESVKLPAKTRNGKSHTSDSQEAADDDRKAADYDKKAYYNEDEVLEEMNRGSRRPQPERESEKSSNFRYRNRGNTHGETKDARRQSHNKSEQSNRNLPHNRNREPVRQESSERTHDGEYYRQKLPQTEKSSLPDQYDSYDTETYEAERPSASNEDKEGSTSHTETTTEDRFPPPPPEFYEEFNKFRHITNPFASLDFDFDEYLDKLRGSPSPPSQQESSKLELTNTEPPKENYHDTEGDVKSTTHENSDSTTTLKPKMEEPDHTETSRYKPSQGRTTEYIKEYYTPPPHNIKNVYNEEIGAYSEEDENQKHNHNGRPADSDTDTVKGSAYHNDHITSTTKAPQLGIATVHHHVKPNPLTVPFYHGEDGNFYANPVDGQPQRPEATRTGGRDTVLPRYSVREENVDTIQSTERIPYLMSTSQSYLQSHSNPNANIREPHEPTLTTPFPARADNAHSLHPTQEILRVPSRASKLPQRGPIRNRPQHSEQIYPSPTTETKKPNHNSRNNPYYESEYHQQHATKARSRVKLPSTTPVSYLPHPFTSSSNRYQYQGANIPSTESPSPRPTEKPVSSLTHSDTKPRKTGHPYIHTSVEENDTIKPMKILKNERAQQRDKELTTTIYNAPIPSSTTEFLSTSSTTRYNDLESYNSWQSTVPYQQEISNLELTTPTQSKYKVTDNYSENRFNSASDLTMPSLPEYTTVKLINMHDTHDENTPHTYSGVRASASPSHELLDSTYDTTKTKFKPRYNTGSENVYIEPGSESANQNPFTKSIFVHQNITTSTISSIPHLKPRHQQPLNKLPRPPGIISHVNKYTTSGADHTTPETYTARHRPSNDHPTLPARQRTHRPVTKSLPSTGANVIVTTTSPPSDIGTTLSTVAQSPSLMYGQLPVVPRRLRRPTKARFDVTSTEAYPDNDKSESIERPLQHNVNRLNKIPLGNAMIAAPHRYSSNWSDMQL